MTQWKEFILIIFFLSCINYVMGDGYGIGTLETDRTLVKKNINKAVLLDYDQENEIAIYRYRHQSTPPMNIREIDAVIDKKNDKILWLRVSTSNAFVGALPTYDHYGLSYNKSLNTLFLFLLFSHGSVDLFNTLSIKSIDILNGQERSNHSIWFYNSFPIDSDNMIIMVLKDGNDHVFFVGYKARNGKNKNYDFSRDPILIIRYDVKTHLTEKMLTPMSFLYPFYIPEFPDSFLNTKTDVGIGRRITSIKINNKRLSGSNLDAIIYYLGGQFIAKKQSHVLALYQFVINSCGKDILDRKVNDTNDSLMSYQKKGNNFIVANKTVMLNKFPALYHLLNNQINNLNENIIHKMNISDWLKDNAIPPAKIAVSNEEIKSFYVNFKWAFRKEFTQNSEYYSLEDAKDFITIEIRRLKHYRLDELLANPPNVEIIFTTVP